MKKPIKGIRFLSFLFVLTLGVLSAPTTVFGQKTSAPKAPAPVCNDLKKQSGKCKEAAKYQKSGFCYADTRSNICICNKEGKYSIVQFKCEANTSTDDDVAAIDLAEFTESPLSTIASPYKGDTEVSFYFGRYPMKYTLKPRENSVAGKRNGSGESMDVVLSLCKKRCQQDIAWDIKKVDNGEPITKFYIMQPGQKRSLPVPECEKRIVLCNEDRQTLQGRTPGLVLAHRRRPFREKRSP